mmetsp:Transcript_52216/g.131921  ORF Transcript_52216/g.131921 Transcript_52216/m.131921 type:complete len:208 (-) Transcript_52216:937-1560(-)
MPAPSWGRHRVCGASPGPSPRMTSRGFTLRREVAHAKEQGLTARWRLQLEVAADAAAAAATAALTRPRSRSRFQHAAAPARHVQRDYLQNAELVEHYDAAHDDVACVEPLRDYQEACDQEHQHEHRQEQQEREASLRVHQVIKRGVVVVVRVVLAQLATQNRCARVAPLLVSTQQLVHPLQAALFAGQHCSAGLADCTSQQVVVLRV